MYNDSVFVILTMFDDTENANVLPGCDAKVLEYLRTAPAKPLRGHLRAVRHDYSQPPGQVRRHFWNRSAEPNTHPEEHLWQENSNKHRSKRSKTRFRNRDWLELIQYTLSEAKDIAIVFGEGLSKVGLCWALGSGYTLHKGFHSA